MILPISSSWMTWITISSMPATTSVRPVELRHLFPLSDERCEVMSKSVLSQFGLFMLTRLIPVGTALSRWERNEAGLQYWQLRYGVSTIGVIISTAMFITMWVIRKGENDEKEFANLTTGLCLYHPLFNFYLIGYAFNAGDDIEQFYRL